MERYDAVIVGAGPAGATLAGLLAQAGWSVAIVEKAMFPRRKVCGEFLSATNYPLLERLGLREAFDAAAGPEIRRVGFLAGDASVMARMPRARGGAAWGRALGREHLDTLLLRRAQELGATVLQPWSAAAIERHGPLWTCTARSAESDTSRRLSAPLVVAAHGSWEAGALPTQAEARRQRERMRTGDLIGFKARFRDCALSPDLMPLLAFPGGYGGMVASDGGRVSLSCCVRRDTLAQLRRRYAGFRAGEAVLEHIQASIAGARDALAGAALDGPILSAGPIRPGIRARVQGGIFLVGNAAGEAHPVIAEGISMAMQSAGLLFDCLMRHVGTARSPDLERAARDYSRRWRAALAPRIVASAALAAMAMRPGPATAMRAIVGLWPRALTAGAYLAGKTKLA